MPSPPAAATSTLGMLTSTYIQEPPFFVELSQQRARIQEIHGARVLALLGDSITTDHISPAGAIPPTARPASTWSSMACRRAISTLMARGAATTG